MRLNEYLRFSLKTKVTLFSLAIFAISIWGLAYYASQVLREDMESQLGAQQFSTTTFVATEVNDELEERVKALELIANTITPAMLKYPVLVQESMDQRLVLQVYFNGGIFVLSPDGIAITDSPIANGRVGVNFMDRKFAIGALKEGKATVGNPVEGKVLMSQVFGIAVPIRDAQGRVIAALVGSTDLARPNFLDKITQNNYGKTGGYLLVAPEIRTVVTATDKRRIMQPLPAPGANPAIDRYINGREGSDVLVNPLGEEVLVSAKGIPVAGWYVVTSLPTAEAFSPIRNMQSNILFATILLTILAGCLIWLMLRRQLVPMLDTIKLISGHAQNASEQRQPLPVYRQDEIGDLVTSFNRLLSGLNQRELDWKREAEKNLVLLRNSSDGIHILDADGDIIEVSDSFCTMLGYTRKELIGMNVAQWDAQIPVSELAPAIAKQIESNTRSQFETRHRRKDGSIFDVEVSGIPFLLYDRRLLYNSSRDITERKRADNALHLNEERLRLALGAANQGWFDVNLQTGEISVSPEYIKMIGYEPENFHTNLDEWISNLHPDDRESLLQVFHRCKETGGPCSMSYRRRHANGGWIWINSVGKVTEWDQNHQPIRMVGIHTDITERKRSEEQVLQRNRQLQVLSRSSQQVNSVLEIPVVMRQLVSAALELTGATDGAAGLMMDGKMVFNEYNLRGSLIPIDYRFDEGYGVPGWVMHSKAPYLSNDAEHDPHVIPEIQKALGFINLTDVPIFGRKGDLLGCFEIHNKVGGFDDSDLLMLQGLSASAAVALENAQILAESKRLESVLQKNEISLKEAQRVAHVGSWTWHTQTNQLDWSDEMFNIFGINKDGFTGDLTAVIARAIHPDDRARVDQANLSVTNHAKPMPLEYRVIWPDGTIRVVWAEAGESIVDEMGNITSLSGIVQDVTERVRTDADLRIAAIAFESQEGMIVTDAKGTILKVNNSFTNITGYSADEVKGRNPRILQSGRQNAVFYVEMWECINQTGFWEGEIWNRRKNGDIYPEHLTISAVRNQSGMVTNYVGTLADITMSKAASEEIQHLAFYDALTGLPNRRLLQDRLKQAFASSARSGNVGALLFIDLDNFKTLNDTLGHDFGDLLLQQIAERLTGCVREGDTVARFGGDEFVVMLEDLGAQDLEAAALAETIGHKILAVLNQPYQLGIHTYHTTGSIGATLFNDHKASIDELLKQADIALYQAKSAGRNAQCFFDPQMQVSITNRVALENELRLALENHQLQLYYQIQVDSSGHALGAEALIRWLHPERGLVSPAQFIPLAEDTGLILPIGQWVLGAACAQLERCQHDPVTCDLSLAVNVSAKQYRQAGFVDQVRAAVQQHTFDPSLLKLELTESLLLDSVENTIAKMGELQKIGIQFSLDDFGTGYSSLQYLKRLPLNQLKIDQSFVHDIFMDSSDQAIVRTIIAMAQTLHLNVIAEGVETDEQRVLLMHNGCTQYQGYLFGKPVPIEQFEALLKRE